MSFIHRLTPESYAYIRRLLSFQTKPLGKVLREADLISSFQLESALLDQLQNPDMRIGEILARNGLIKPETADFFVRDWSKIISQTEKDALGYYLHKAAILSSEQVEIILAEQKSSGIRFGTVGVFQGFIKSTTLDFFLAHLYPEEIHSSPFVNMYSTRKS
ncbi:MAG: hypothetical protein AAGE96_01400 [Cyanobacteria bacterium P01_G01_bin.19]